MPDFPSTETINNLLDPILTPSGIWADYNPVYQWYLELLQMQKIGILDSALSIPAPRVSDYPDMTSPRSSNWPTGRGMPPVPDGPVPAPPFPA